MYAKTAKVISVINKLKIKGDKLLDVGCANGDLTLRLKEALESSAAFGIEISPQRAEIARMKGINVIQMDIEEVPLPFDDSTFDVIICTEIMEHLYNPSHLLRETRRCLKTGGNCIIMIPNLASWYNRLLLLFGYQPYSTSVGPEVHDVGYPLKGSYETGGHLYEGGKDHVRLMTLRAFRELVKLSGFQVKSVAGVPTGATFLTPSLRISFRFLENLACRFPSCASFILAVLVKPSQ